MNEKDVIQPDHYQSEEGKECIVMMCETYGKERVIDFCQFNAFKYLYRQDKKGVAEQDLQKARWYVTVAELLNQGRHINTALAYVRSESYKELVFPENNGGFQILENHTIGGITDILPTTELLYKVTVEKANKNGRFIPVLPDMSLICYEDSDNFSRTYFYA